MRAAPTAKPRPRRDPFLEEAIIIVDSREQAAWSWEGVKTVVQALPSGDYSLKGYEDKIALERKSLGDYRACCGPERGRFEAELERLSLFPFAAVLVEAPYAALWQPSRWSTGQRTISPASLASSAAAWSLRFCPVFFCGSRDLARDFGLRLLKLWFKDAQEQPSVAGNEPEPLPALSEEVSQ